MRKAEEDLLDLLRAWRDSGRLATDIQKITASAASSGMSEDEIDRLVGSWIAQFPRRNSGWIGAEAALVDLSALLNGPSNRKQKAWNRARRVAGWSIDHYVAVASMVTVLATLFYGLAYTIFFRQLDITSEQAGLTPPWFLTRSALGGLLLTMVFALAMYSVVLPVVPVRDDSAARTTKGSSGKTLINLLVAVAGGVYILLFTLAMGLPLTGSIAIAAIPLVLLLFFSLRILTHDNRGRPNLRPLSFDFDKYLAIFLIPVLPFGLLAAGAATITKAYQYGRDASKGQAVRAPKIIGSPLLGVRAEPALVDWRAGSAHPGFPPCALYVDGADGAAFLYDHRSGRTLQFHSDAMGVELRNRAETCDAPLNQKLPTVGRLKGASLKCFPGDWRTYQDPRFRYQWIREGARLDNRSPHRRVFDRGRAASLENVKCRVIAWNDFGRDIALSRRVHIPKWELLRRDWPPRRGGAPDQRPDDRR